MPSVKSEEMYGRVTNWRDSACVIPIGAVLLGWAVSIFLYNRVIRCDGTAWLRCRDPGPLEPLNVHLSALDLAALDTVRVAHDVATRFAWHPTMVAFALTAIGVSIVCAYLIHHALKDSVAPAHHRKWFAVILVAVVVAGVVSWVRYPQWIVRTEILTPIMTGALGSDSSAIATVDFLQRGFQTLAVIASCFVVFAASTALLTRDRREWDDDDRADHLTEQWRRLRFALFAGAMLLVTAIVHQTAQFGWSSAFAKAVAETQEQRNLGAVTRLETTRLTLEEQRAALRRDSLPTVVRNAEWRTRNTAQARLIARTEEAYDSARYAVQRDTIAGAARVKALNASMTRATAVVTAAITRGAAVVYSILLALTYLPAALVLMERARELSYKMEKDEAARLAWRTKHGIDFSIGSQWSKVFAVLSPILASGGAALLFKFFE